MNRLEKANKLADDICEEMLKIAKEQGRILKVTEARRAAMWVVVSFIQSKSQNVVTAKGLLIIKSRQLN